jgi:hypothetical protein
MLPIIQISLHMHQYPFEPLVSPLQLMAISTRPIFEMPQFLREPPFLLLSKKRKSYPTTYTTRPRSRSTAATGTRIRRRLRHSLVYLPLRKMTNSFTCDSPLVATFVPCLPFNTSRGATLSPTLRAGFMSPLEATILQPKRGNFSVSPGFRCDNNTKIQYHSLMPHQTGARRGNKAGPKFAATAEEVENTSGGARCCRYELK